ncbi:hypothetical protein [Streptacidiphilus jeojiense]|uniref:hypothetical protein n=1 Tax=Streptacidiphilus jeojiense TaxID=436229 RepID=UPI0004C07AE6|nr:hypothetical protein [Streptacidiphilus jeojiense]
MVSELTMVMMLFARVDPVEAPARWTVSVHRSRTVSLTRTVPGASVAVTAEPPRVALMTSSDSTVPLTPAPMLT